MEKQYYPPLDETVYRQTLPSGLPVCVVPRPGFSRKMAYFAVNFGSIHRQFTLDGRPCTLQPGTAHFLEHKMFDMPDGRDVFGEFAALGAIPNAFTSYDMTAYYFSATENFRECLHLLLEYVSTPYFTEESVSKEQGIIGQEIVMSQDSPDSRIFELLMETMYRVHPVGETILGTRESIAAITPESLYAAHSAFYRPDNMFLCVVGDVDPQEVCAIASEVLPGRAEGKVAAQRQWDEPLQCSKQTVTAAMEVSMPMFQLGFRCAPLGAGEKAVRQEFLGDLALEALFGESSPLYLQLYRKGLIDGTFGGGYETIEGMALISVSGDSKDPQAVQQAILEEAERIAREGIPEAEVLRMKRSAMGRRLRGLDNFDATCFRLCAYQFSNYDYFRFPALYPDITARELQDFIAEVIRRDRMCLCTITPIDKEVS